MKLVENLNSNNSISFRPERLSEYIGQDHIKDILEVSINASKMRGDTLDHILLYGPPGLGKTTLAQIISNEMESNIRIITGNSIEKSGDIASILTSLENGDILFIDEIHRIPKVAEETIYSAMEDFKLHIMVNRGLDSDTITIDLPRFTLIGATTRSGLLSKPLRDRFIHNYRMEFYSVEDLQKIVINTITKFGKNIDDESAIEIARRSRGTPRIAINISKKIRDYADHHNRDIDIDFTKEVLNRLNIDERGLDSVDMKYLKILEEIDKPISIKTLSAILSEDIRTIEEVIEPYLLEKGYILKTNRGRILNRKE